MTSDANFYNGYHRFSKIIDNSADIMSLVDKLVDHELCPNYGKRIENLLSDMKHKTDDEKEGLEIEIENDGIRMDEINGQKRRIKELWREKSEECDELKAENRHLLLKLCTIEGENEELKIEANRSAKQRGLWREELSGY